MDEENKKNKTNFFTKIFIFLVLVYICLYSINLKGYVERMNGEKTLITEEEIKKFESDVENGNMLDMEEYNKNREVDYSNKVSDFGEKLSSSIEYCSHKTMDWLNRILSIFFE